MKCAMGLNDTGPWKRYGVSKLCNVLFMLELDRRLKAAGETRVSTSAVHPGWASTQLQKVAGDAGSMPGWQDMNRKSAQSSADGSLPLLMACVDKTVMSG